MAIQRISNGDSDYYVAKWQVDSFTDSSKSYVVSRTRTGEMQCSCPVWKFRRRECKHIDAVRQDEDQSSQYERTYVETTRRRETTGVEPTRQVRRRPEARPEPEFRVRPISRLEKLKREIETM